MTLSACCTVGMTSVAGNLTSSNVDETNTKNAVASASPTARLRPLRSFADLASAAIRRSATSLTASDDHSIMLDLSMRRDSAFDAVSKLLSPARASQPIKDGAMRLDACRAELAKWCS